MCFQIGDSTTPVLHSGSGAFLPLLFVYTSGILSSDPVTFSISGPCLQTISFNITDIN